MKLKHFHAFVLFSLLTGVTFVPSLTSACDSNLRVFPEECTIQDRFRAVRARLNQMGTPVENLMEYRALRFIDRGSWERAKKTMTPLLPELVYEPKPKTWNIWERGEKFSHSSKPGAPFDLSFVQKLHRQAITIDLMSGPSVWLKAGAPGRIRSYALQLPPGSGYDCKDEEITDAVADLLTHYDLRTPSGRPLVDATLTPCSEIMEYRGKQTPRARFPNSPFYRGMLTYLSSIYVPDELERWSRESQSNWSRLLTGQDTSLSPLEQIADIQRWFVSIHPFGDGNGRVSRLIQDRLLSDLDLPSASSGDLQSDIFTSKFEYRKAMRRAVFRSLETLESCANRLESREHAPECESTSLPSEAQ